MRQLAELRRMAVQADVYRRRIVSLDAKTTTSTVDQIERALLVRELSTMGLPVASEVAAPADGGF